MNRIATLLGIALLAAGPAAAQGINLAWDDCYAGSGAPNKSAACSSEDPERALVVSVEPNLVFDDIVGFEGQIDVIFDSGDIPDYWRFDLGACMQNALVGDPYIGSLNPPFSCAPWTSGQLAGGIQYTPYVFCNNRARILFAYATFGDPATLDPAVAQEWYLLRLRVIGGASNCAGCETPACLALNEVRLYRPAGDPRGNVYISIPAVSQHASWQNQPFCPSTGPGGPPCPTPVQSPTWGGIKSMYR